MLLLLVSLPLLSYAEWGLENFAVDNRFVIPIDTCINNVTKNGVSQTFQDYGSLVCRCSQGKGPTTSGAACFYYADPDCVGDFTDFDSWGGCDNRASTPIIYTVEGCSTAQQVAATTQCAYAVRNFATTYINDKIFPIGPCLDYQCASTNSDPDSRSCSYECDSGAIERTDYSDYTCDNAEGTPTPTPSIDNKVCTPTPTCGVTITSYTAGTTVYECGSKKSPFKTSRDLSSKTSNYILLENDLRPTPIGQCAETRRGYYSFSTKYMCIEDDILEDVYTVELWKFLGNGDCEDTGDNTYLIETYVPENNTFVCGKSDSKGRIGYYGDCENPNWKSWYSDSLTMFGTCLNFRSDPLTKASDESPEGDQPWYQNLRYVISCNLGKAYPSVYVYVTADCTGDYLFYWDADNYYTAKQYSGQDCAYPQVRNCGNTLDQVSNGKLPSKVKTCQST